MVALLQQWQCSTKQCVLNFLPFIFLLLKGPSLQEDEREGWCICELRQLQVGDVGECGAREKHVEQ